MGFSFEQLRGFVAVAEERHFGRAATRLSMTQPPLSRQIQKLERAVGTPLLVRGQRGVDLTPAGEAFLAEARRLLDLADNAPDLARRIGGGTSGTIRLGFTAAATFHALPALLARLAHALPEVEVELREMLTGEQTSALLSGAIDAGLARPWFDPKLLGNLVAERQELMVVVPANHRLAERGTPVSPADLVDEELIMHSYEEAPYLHHLVSTSVPLDRPRVSHTVSQLITMVSLVAAGRGLAFLPASTQVLNVDRIVYLPLAVRPRPCAELHLLWLHSSHHPALRRLLDLAAEDGMFPV
jgi:DNA-binding transcriptional LysR family regulator